ncbi:MAG: hypothetical protein NTZ49_03825 [Candidatus Parcubacteria bacterium]|nr:hypothetical protein [Candidatus Parcubacteria bacterium]
MNILNNLGNWDKAIVKIRCKSCGFEELSTEYMKKYSGSNTCPKCQQTTLTLVMNDGKVYDLSGAKPQVKIQAWLIMVSVMVIFVCYKLFVWQVFLPVSAGIILFLGLYISRLKKDM